MKALILIAALFSLSAHAMSPVRLDDNVVVQLTVGGGMPVPGGLAYRQVTLDREGVVTVQENRLSRNLEDGRWERREYTLATVPARDMLEIGKAVATLRGGRLTKADRPPCMDAPSYDYVVNMNGAPVSFYRVSSCIDEQPVDKTQRAAATSLKTFLDQLNQMAH